jgi:hypothetical protein
MTSVTNTTPLPTWFTERTVGLTSTERLEVWAGLSERDLQRFSKHLADHADMSRRESLCSE